MSYQSEVLADTPTLYYRLDQLGFGSNGETVPDLSGNGFDATLNFTGGAAAWGHPSPIETDASSKEFWGYTNATVYDPGFTGASGIVRASSGALDPSGGDCAIEGWLRPMDERPSAADFAMFQKQGSIGIMLGGGATTRIAGFLFDSAVTFWSVVDTSIAVANDLGRSYHVVCERVGNALVLYINGQLKATTTITSGLPTLFTGSSFNIQPSTGFYTNARHDEVAYYLHSLGGARVLVHYEAALATLNSSATITVRVPVFLDTDSVEPIDFPFTHNWADPIGGSERVITEFLNWRTHFNRSEPDYQQRVNAQPHGPRRVMEVALTPQSALGRAQLQRLLWQPAGAYKLPVDTDWTVLTAQADPTDVLLDCDTTLRDFEVGSYASVWVDVRDPSTYQSFRITSVSNTQLGVTPAVATTLPLGSTIMPARLACLPDEELNFESYVIDSESALLRFEMLNTELSTRQVTAYTPDSTYLSYEVFSLDSARFQVLEQQPYVLSRRQLGTGLLTGNDYYRAVDTASGSTIPVKVLLTTREQLSEFRGWMEARQGRQNPVWVPSRENDLVHVAVLSIGVTSTLKVRGYSTYNVHYQRRDLQLLRADSSIINCRVTAMVDNGNGTENITVDANVTGTVVKISFLKLCVAPDSFELRYHRDTANPGIMTVECAWQFRELLTTLD